MVPWAVQLQVRHYGNYDKWTGYLRRGIWRKLRTNRARWAALHFKTAGNFWNSLLLFVFRCSWWKQYLNVLVFRKRRKLIHSLWSCEFTRNTVIWSITGIIQNDSHLWVSCFGHRGIWVCTGDWHRPIPGERVAVDCAGRDCRSTACRLETVVISELNYHNVPADFQRKSSFNLGFSLSGKPAWVLECENDLLINVVDRNIKHTTQVD